MGALENEPFALYVQPNRQQQSVKRLQNSNAPPAACHCARERCDSVTTWIGNKIDNLRDNGARQRQTDPFANRLDTSSETDTESYPEDRADSPAPIAPTGTLARAARVREEWQIAKRIQAGDKQAFEELLDLYETRVYRLALRFTGAVSDAEDVTQEIFLGIYRSIGSFRGSAALGTWIYRIAMNHCLEFRRKRKLDSIPYDEEIMLVSNDWREDPAQSADKQELATKVEAALGCLSAQHRDVVVLHELQGMTYQEVATLLNVPVGTVKSRLSNALRRLRDLLGAYVTESAR